ncbi:MAG: response regulator, partial [Planctomycetota bacterium]
MTAASQNCDGKRILVVDDMPFCRETIAEILRREGFNVLCACDGVEALGMLKKEPVDGLLLDVMMPRMDGLTLLNSLRRDPRWSRLPVILLTDVAEKEKIRL